MHHAHSTATVHTPEDCSRDLAFVLRSGGFRVTGTRVALLTLLESVGTPLSVQAISEGWKGKPAPDTATLYRSLTDLHAAGIVRRIELGTGAAHYEYTPTRPHHHHIVCNDCGVVEELLSCALSGVEDTVVRESSQFSSIYSHNLEFFGRCTSCATVT